VVHCVQTFTVLTRPEQKRVLQYVPFLSIHRSFHGQLTDLPSDFPDMKLHTQTRQRQHNTVRLRHSFHSS
jgi:hypothetical protein